VKTHKLIDPLRNKDTQSFAEYQIESIDHQPDVNEVIELHRAALVPYHLDLIDSQP
jgi:hypothetical protein